MLYTLRFEPLLGQRTPFVLDSLQSS